MSGWKYSYKGAWLTNNVSYFINAYVKSIFFTIGDASNLSLLPPWTERPIKLIDPEWPFLIDNLWESIWGNFILVVTCWYGPPHCVASPRPMFLLMGNGAGNQVQQSESGWQQCAGTQLLFVLAWQVVARELPRLKGNVTKSLWRLQDKTKTYTYATALENKMTCTEIILCMVISANIILDYRCEQSIFQWGLMERTMVNWFGQVW